MDALAAERAQVKHVTTQRQTHHAGRQPKQKLQKRTLTALFMFRVTVLQINGKFAPSGGHTCVHTWENIL